MLKLLFPFQNLSGRTLYLISMEFLVVKKYLIVHRFFNTLIYYCFKGCQASNSPDYRHIKRGEANTSPRNQNSKYSFNQSKSDPVRPNIYC